MRNRSMLLAALLLVSALGVALSSSSRAVIDPVDVETTGTFSVADQAYVTFVFPRIAALDRELADIRRLVEERSRNVFALNAGGDRIRDLVEQFERAPRPNDLDPSLVVLHGRIEALGDSLVEVLDGAEQSFTRFDFSAIPDLIPRFESAGLEVSAIRRDLESRVEVGGPGTLTSSVL